MTAPTLERESATQDQAPQSAHQGARRRGGGYAWLAWPVLAILVVLTVVPVVTMFYSSVRTRPIGAPGNEFTFHAIVEVYTSGPYLRTLFGTLLLALLCAVIATGGGGLFAWILTRTDIRFRGFFEMVILAPLFLSPFIGAVAWVALAAPKSGMLNVNLGHLLGREGEFTLINVMSVPGLIWVLSLYYIPYGYLFVSAALRNMDAALEEASYVNGYSTWRTARRVTFPLVRPAMVASFFFIAVLATGVFTVPTVLATSTGFVPLAVRMYRAVGVYPTDYAVGGAIGTLLFFLTVLGVYLYRRAVGNSKRFVTVGGRGYRPRLIRLGPWRPVWAILLFGYFLAAVALPYAALIIISLTPYAQTDLTDMSLSLANFTKVAGSAKVVDATINTLLLGVAAPTACVVLGLMIAFIVQRSRSRLRGTIDYLSTVTVAIPGIVLGLGMLWVYVRTPLYATPWILLLAYVALYVPHAARLAGSGLMQIDPALEEASTINGAPLWRTLGRVTFPLTKPALLSAWILIFIFSGREVNAAIILYTPASAVLPVLTFDYADSGLVQNAAVVGILQTCMLLTGVLVARVLFRVKLSSSM